MAVFDADARWYHDLDWQLVQDSFITLFRSGDRLEYATTGLQDRGYRVVTLDAARWHSEADMHTGIASALYFPDYYGRNFDALDDCLIDVAAGDYGLDPTTDTGLALVLIHYDSFAEQVPRAHLLLDIFATQARGAALYGHRMMCLVDSDLPAAAFPRVGGTGIHVSITLPAPALPPEEKQ